MKKAITILAVLIVLVGAVFADDSEVKPAGKEKITVVTKVDRELPVLMLVGALSQDALETAGTDSATVAQTGYAKEKDVTPAEVADVSATAYNGTPLDARNSNDISHEDLTVYFKVTSAAARCDLVYNISVEAGKFKAVDNNTEYTIDKDVTFAHQTAGDDQTYLKITGVGTAGTAFTATATYSGATTAATIGTFDITWQKDNYAPEATYKADVTMTYTVQ